MSFRVSWPPMMTTVIYGFLTQETEFFGSMPTEHQLQFAFLEMETFHRPWADNSLYPSTWVMEAAPCKLSWPPRPFAKMKTLTTAESHTWALWHTIFKKNQLFLSLIPARSQSSGYGRPSPQSLGYYGISWDQKNKRQSSLYNVRLEIPPVHTMALTE